MTELIWGKNGPKGQLTFCLFLPVRSLVESWQIMGDCRLNWCSYPKRRGTKDAGWPVLCDEISSKRARSTSTAQMTVMGGPGSVMD